MYMQYCAQLLAFVRLSAIQRLLRVYRCYRWVVQVALLFNDTLSSLTDYDLKLRSEPMADQYVQQKAMFGMHYTRIIRTCTVRVI